MDQGGSGKNGLVNIIGGMDQASEGEFFLKGKTLITGRKASGTAR